MADEPAREWRIAELAARAGVTPRTVRYYVAEGLLPPPGGAGQQRTYSGEHLLRLAAIKRLKEAYLPLDEIRRRLAAVGPGELERLAEAPEAAPPTGALDYIAAVLAAQPPHQPTGGAAAPHPPPYHVAQAQQDAGTGRHPGAMAQERPDSEAPRSTVWHRAVLAPGVELHYQEGGNDARRDAAVARLIREGRELLSSPPPETTAGT
jgi:DNA-binding transcriptional MerR regulator